MPSEPDVNKITADLLHRIFSDTVRNVSSGVRDAVSKSLDVFKKDFSAYLTATITKCSLIKTPIINRDTPTYLFDIYVHTKLKLKNKIFTNDDFIAELPKLQSVVIAGNAGSGKSMFMRYLFMAMCERGFGRVPLFIELRNLNSISVKDLLQFMYYTLVGTGGVISKNQFEASLKNGTFSVSRTRIKEYFFRHRKIAEKLLANIEKDVQRQRDVLESLIS